MIQSKTFDQAAADGAPAHADREARMMRLVRAWAATWIKVNLNSYGTPATSIATTCQVNHAASVTARPDPHVSFTMLGLTGEGLSIDAALRHWCEQAEER
jgi:hypothetical protein